MQIGFAGFAVEPEGDAEQALVAAIAKNFADNRQFAESAIAKLGSELCDPDRALDSNCLTLSRGCDESDRELSSNALLRSDDGSSREEERSAFEPRVKPHFDEATGKLWFREQLIRRYVRRAKNCVAVLKAFQEHGWPYCVKDPLSNRKNAERLNNTACSLNQSLRGIRFHAGGDGESFSWTVVN